MSGISQKSTFYRYPVQGMKWSFCRGLTVLHSGGLAGNVMAAAEGATRQQQPPLRRSMSFSSYEALHGVWTAKDVIQNAGCALVLTAYASRVACAYCNESLQKSFNTPVLFERVMSTPEAQHVLVIMRGLVWRVKGRKKSL